MHSYAELLALMLGAGLGIFIAHGSVNRVIRFMRRGESAPQLVVLGTIAACNIAVVWIAWTVAFRGLGGNALEVACGFVYVLLTFNSIGFCYFNVLNASETSLHVHILTELLLFGAIAEADLAKKYSSSDVIGARIERMIALGQLMEVNGYYVLNGRALVMVGKGINLWRRLLRLPLGLG